MYVDLDIYSQKKRYILKNVKNNPKAQKKKINKIRCLVKNFDEKPKYYIKYNDDMVLLLINDKIE